MLLSGRNLSRRWTWQTKLKPTTARVIFWLQRGSLPFAKYAIVSSDAAWYMVIGHGAGIGLNH